jgi:hypothetical protein
VCGILVKSASSTATGGSVTKASIGACVTDPKMSVECLHGAQYREVGIPLQADSYGLPDALPDGTRPPPPPCPKVDAERPPSW